MNKKLCVIFINGSDDTHVFFTYCNIQLLEYYKQEGIEIYQVVNYVPVWASDLGIERIWCFLQDLWNFKWLDILIYKIKILFKKIRIIKPQDIN